ncbi:hypothetical protein ACFLXE_00150 [Chloroflexota bacterium]
MPNDVQDAIEKGLAWCVRSLWWIGSEMAVVKDNPALPLWVKCPSYSGGSHDGIINAGESTFGKASDYPVHFQSRCTQEGFTTIQEDGYTEPEICEFEFKGPELTGTGSNRVKVRTTLYAHGTSNMMKVVLRMLEYSSTSELEVWFGTEKIWTGNKVGAEYEETREQDYGWFGCRYNHRHASRVLARTFEACNRYQSSIVHRFYAKCLHQFMDYVGFTYDYYDGIFGADWDYPDDYLTEKEALPDPEIWVPNVAPMRGGNYTPYRSMAETETIRDLYQGRHIPFTNMDMAFAMSPNYDCVKAQHLMNKYGDANPYIGEAFDRLERAGFDGFGTRRFLYIGDSDHRIPTWAMERSAHETYSLATFCAACTTHYALTSSATTEAWARKAAKLLIGCQWGEPTGEEYHDLTRYHGMSSGGFIGSYLHGSNPQFVTQDSMQEFIYNLLRNVGMHNRSTPEYPGKIYVASEPTVLAVAALVRFREVFGESTSTPVSEGTVCPTLHLPYTES